MINITYSQLNKLRNFSFRPSIKMFAHLSD